MAYHLLELDENLKPIGELANVRSISIQRDASGDETLIESASIEFDTDEYGWEGGWYRIDYTDDSRIMLGVFYFELTSQTYNHDVITVKADGYSVLKPAQDNYVITGNFAAAGSSVGDTVRELLSDCINVDIQGMALLSKTVVYDDDTSKLKAAWAVLDAAKWCMQLSGDGVIEVKPYPTDIYVIDADAYSEIEPSISFDDDVTYSRKYTEEVYPFDLVRISIPKHGIDGTYRVLSQDIDTGAALKISETIGTLDRGEDD